MLSYRYEEHRDHVFTDDGQRLLLKARDRAQKLLSEAGAVSIGAIIAGLSGDSWKMLACVDRLVEIGDLLEVPNPHSGAGQHRLFIKGRG